MFPPYIPYIKHSHGIYYWREERKYDTIQFPVFNNIANTIRLSCDIIRNMDVWFYGLGHKLKTEYQLWIEQKAPLKWDYISCMSVCTFENELDTIALNHTGQHTGVNNFHNKLKVLFKSKLNELPYKKSPITNLNFAIGNCSEQNAANDMLSEKNCEIRELRFSKAFRPRTMTFIPPCANCSLLFPQTVS